jgi:uncharacterized protein
MVIVPLTQHNYTPGGPNHIKVTKNACGCVYALPMDGAWSITSMKGIVCGTPVDPDTNDGQACDVNGIASPDNLAFMKGTNTLIIYEDTSLHNNCAMWAMDVVEGPSKSGWSGRGVDVIEGPRDPQRRGRTPPKEY